MSRRGSRLAAALAAASLAIGCQDSIHRGWLVDRPRVLGARVEAASDPQRAALAPGEAAAVTWLIAAPEGTPSFAWAYAACAPPTGDFAEVRCGDRPVLASGSGAASGELTRMALAMPPDGALGDAPSLLVLAAFCPAGPPALDAAGFTATCDGGGEALLASVSVAARAAGDNQNPRPPSGLTIGGAALPSDDRAPSGAPCDAAPAAPVMAAGQKPKLTYAFQDADREPGESLVLSFMTTAGTLEHQYFALDPAERAPKTVDDEWTAPGGADVESGGRVVRFYAVLRDGRGGTSFERFAVCVR